MKIFYFIFYIEENTYYETYWNYRSNAEQHFLGYKSIAAKEAGFKKMIQKGTAILDVGGGGLQVSLFDKDTLVTTQSLKMGSMRIR